MWKLLILVAFFATFDVTAQGSCEESPMSECGCPRRGTFDSAFLENVFPEIAAKYPAHNFYAPTVTYPDCAAIIAMCQQDNSQMVVLVNGSTDLSTTMDFVDLTTSLNVTTAFCNTNKEWFKPGAGSLQAKLNSYKLGCQIPK